MVGQWHRSFLFLGTSDSGSGLVYHKESTRPQHCHLLLHICMGTTCILRCLASQVLLKQTEGRLYKIRVCGPATPSRFNFLSCIVAYLQLPLIDYCDAKMTLYFNGSLAGITWKNPSGEVGWHQFVPSVDLATVLILALSWKLYEVYSFQIAKCGITPYH